jgi:dCTP deaminase
VATLDASIERREPALPAPGVLVDHQIQDLMRLGLLKIADFDSDSLQAASYDFRVGPSAAVTTASKPVDLREQPLILEPYSAALVLVEEIIELSDRVLGRLGAHSNLFKRGIFGSIGPQIDPGWSGRLRVSLLNMTEHPFLIRHKTPFITAEFHLLAEAPSKRHPLSPGATELTEEEINQILGRGGPSLKDVNQNMVQLLQTMKDAATLGTIMPHLVGRQEEAIAKMANVAGYLQGLSATRLGTVPLVHLEPGRYELERDIPVVLQPSDDGFIATFFDANIATGGDTEQEALDNLRSLIIDTFEMLESEPSEKLGPEPRRQLKVLRSLIRKVRQNAD